MDKIEPRPPRMIPGVTYKANGEPLAEPRCRKCGGILIGGEIPAGLCGHDQRGGILRALFPRR